MNRRQLLLSIPISLLATGCVKTNSSIGHQNSTVTSSQSQSQMLSAKIIKVRYDKPQQNDGPTPPRDDNGDYRETATATFDCTNKTALLTGWLFTSSCRTVHIKSLSYNEEKDRAVLVLYPKWDNPKSPKQVNCAGAKYNYQIRLKTKNSLPGEIHVVYKRPKGKDSTQFTISNDDC